MTPEPDETDTAPVVFAGDQFLQPHRMFSIPEILDLVMECYSDEWPIVREPQLARCARVSRLWSEAALRWLWRDADLINLAALLSPLIYVDESWTLEYDPTETSINSFLRYAPLVKSLKHEQWLGRSDGSGSMEESTLSDDVFSHILAIEIPQNYDGLLFPNLKGLIWFTYTDESIAQSLHFQSYPLKELHFSFPTDPELASTVYGTMTSLMRIPSLRELIVSFAREDDLPTELREDLQDLACNWMKDQPDLTRMDLHGIDLFEPFRIVADHRLLQTLTLETIVHERLTEISDFIVAVTDTCPDLEEAEFKFRRSGSSSEDLSILPFRALRPFLRFRQLTKLSIACQYILPLSVADIQTMGQAWPQMLKLSLCAVPPMDSPPAVGTPLSSLATFAQHFSSSLHQLAHYFILDTLSEPSKPFSWLEKLDVGVSQIPYTSSAEVASFIAALCPYELHLVWHWDIEERYAQTWRVVNDFLKSRGSRPSPDSNSLE